MKVKNDTDLDQIKVCLYKEGDHVDWVPVGTGVFIVKQGDTFIWTPPHGEELPQYHMKVFRPELIDRFLAERTVRLNESVAVRGGSGSYRIDTM